MFNNFDGEGRRRPQVNLGGSGRRKESKEALLQRAQEERSQRQENRRRQASAVKIQSLVRGYQTRCAFRQWQRNQFDQLRQSYTATTPSLTSNDQTQMHRLQHQMASKIVCFFSQHQDAERLTWLCLQCIWPNRSFILNQTGCDGPQWYPNLMGLLLRLCFKFCAESHTHTLLLLNFIQHFFWLPSSPSPHPQLSDPKSLPFFYAVVCSTPYFRYLRSIADRHIPTAAATNHHQPDDVIRPPEQQPDQLVSLILGFMMRPVTCIAPHSDVNSRFNVMMLRGLTDHFLAVPYSQQVEHLILPALAESPDFPFGRWMEAVSEAPQMKATPWLLFSSLTLGQRHTANSWPSELLVSYLIWLNRMLSCILPFRGVSDQLGDKLPGIRSQEDNSSDSSNDGEDDEEQPEDEQDDMNEESGVGGGMSEGCHREEAKRIIRLSLQLLNQPGLVRQMVSLCESGPCSDHRRPDGGGHEVLHQLCRLCHKLLLFDSQAIHRHRLLFHVAFRPRVLYHMWTSILNTASKDTVMAKPTPLWMILSRGMKMSVADRDTITPLLAVFSSLFAFLLVTIHDLEFYGEEGGRDEGGSRFVAMPFSLSELVPMCLVLRDVTLGLVELAFPESRPTVTHEYHQAIKSIRKRDANWLNDAQCQGESGASDTLLWSHLFKATVQLLRQLHSRDTRRPFCPDGHWISDRITLPAERQPHLNLRASALRTSALRRYYRPFVGLRVLTRDQIERGGPPLSTQEVRLATVLRQCPFVVSFSQRLRLFHNLVAKDREHHQGDMSRFLQGNAIRLHIRRDFLYEDAFAKLSIDNEPNMKLVMRVKMSNEVGLEEAGIDGGGVFREFLSELLKTCFDPNRGFFKQTQDQQLYPNSKVERIVDNFVQHYFFIGRMVGKALYENMLVELPLASFFLSKLLGQESLNEDLDHLQSLDPVLYKNLLYLKTYDGDVHELGLDFTVASEEFGQTSVEELKPGGSSIPVTNDNRIEYIHLVADYKLNKQIRPQCNAFRLGLADVIDLDWLRVFSYRELQTLISGADMEIDVDDLKQNTNYGNGFSEEHQTIVAFWRVVRTMSEQQKRNLLKFVTSCSRPPLLGFKELYPPFCIQNAGSEEDRLPTASTCMNLLKLPDFQSAEVLKAKLLYAIESGSGFELS